MSVSGKSGEHERPPFVAASAKFSIGMKVRHRRFGFRGVIFDIDPVFNNTEEWYQSIPEDMRPSKDQPYYHLFAENEDSTSYIAYVSEQNLVPEDPEREIHHPAIGEFFDGFEGGLYIPRRKPN